MPKNDPQPLEVWWQDQKRFVIESVQDGLVFFGAGTRRDQTINMRYYLKDDTPVDRLPIGDFLEQFEPPCTFDIDGMFPYREGTCDACGTEGVELAYHTYVKHDDGTHTNYFLCEQCWATVPIGQLSGMFKEQTRLREEKLPRPTVWDRLID